MLWNAKHSGSRDELFDLLWDDLTRVGTFANDMVHAAEEGTPLRRSKRIKARDSIDGDKPVFPITPAVRSAPLRAVQSEPPKRSLSQAMIDE